jgi:hypothetical protein
MSEAVLYAEGMLGRDAEEFIESELGRFMIGRAEQEIADAMNELKTCYPWRTRRIKELQNRIWRAESFQNWLGELVVRGHQALQQLETPED